MLKLGNAQNMCRLLCKRARSGRVRSGTRCNVTTVYYISLPLSLSLSFSLSLSQYIIYIYTLFCKCTPPQLFTVSICCCRVYQQADLKKPARRRQLPTLLVINHFEFRAYVCCGSQCTIQIIQCVLTRRYRYNYYCTELVDHKWRLGRLSPPPKKKNL